MSDYIIVSCKRGNGIETAKDMLLHGEPVDYFDPDVYNPELSDYCRSAYLFFKMPKSQMPYIAAMVSANRGGELYAREKQFDLDKVSVYAKIPGINNKENTKETLPVYDITGMSGKDVFKENEKEPVTDLMATTTGTHTVGSAGSFATWALAFADFGHFTGAVTLNQISDTTETGSHPLTENFGAHDFTLDSTNPHNGVWGGGWVSTQTTEGLQFLRFAGTAGTGTVEVENLEIRQHTTGYNFFFDSNHPGPTKIHDILSNTPAAGTGYGVASQGSISSLEIAPTDHAP